MHFKKLTSIYPYKDADKHRSPLLHEKWLVVYVTKYHFWYFFLQCLLTARVWLTTPCPQHPRCPRRNKRLISVPREAQVRYHLVQFLVIYRILAISIYIRLRLWQYIGVRHMWTCRLWCTGISTAAYTLHALKYGQSLNGILLNNEH